MIIIQDVALSINLRQSWTPSVALLWAIKLREVFSPTSEVFSPTPSHTTLLIWVNNYLLYVCLQEEHGRQWEGFVVKRRMTFYSCFHSIYRSLSLSVFCLAFLRSLSSVFSVSGSLSLSFILVIYNQSLTIRIRTLYPLRMTSCCKE